MHLDAQIKQERKYSRYGVWLFSAFILLQLMAYIYDQMMGHRVHFPYSSIIINLVMIFGFRYTYSLVYLFKLLNQLEEREVRKAVQQRANQQGKSSDDHA